MRRVLSVLFVFGLVACGAETGTDDQACREADLVVEQISDYRALSQLTPEQAETARQWEFRLAEASVVATDHGLSDDLRDLADAAGNVAADMKDDSVMRELDGIYSSVTERCN